MIFWPLRLAILLAGVVTLAVNWRLGSVMLFALAADLATTLWMVLPLFSVRNEFLLVFATALPLGVLTAIGRGVVSPIWFPASLCSGVLVLLEGTVYLVGLAEGTLAPQDVVQTVPSAVVLVVASGTALLLPAVVLRSRSPRETGRT